MDILLVVHQFLPRHLGGTEVYTYELARALSERHQVAVFCMSWGSGPEGGPSLEQTEAEGFSVLTVHRPPTGLLATPPGLLVGSYRSRSVERYFVEYLDRARPEIVHFQHLVNLSCALPHLVRSRGTPALMTLHDYWFMCSNCQLFRPNGQTCQGSWGWGCAYCLATAKRPWLTPLQPGLALAFAWRNRTVRRALADIGLFVAPSRFLQERFQRWCGGQKQVLYLENGIDGTRFRRTRHTEQGERLRLAYLGAILPHKGIEVLLQALHLLHEADIELHIYGDPRALPEYGQRITEACIGLAAHLEGPVPRELVPEVLARADLLVVPSLWYENSPLVIQEAFASGVPVLISDGGAMVEKIRPGVDGMCFRRGDATDLAAKLELLAGRPEMVQQMRAHLRSPQSIRDNAQQLEAIYEGLIRGGG